MAHKISAIHFYSIQHLFSSLALHLFQLFDTLICIFGDSLALASSTPQNWHMKPYFRCPFYMFIMWPVARNRWWIAVRLMQQGLPHSKRYLCDQEDEKTSFLLGSSSSLLSRVIFVVLLCRLSS